MQLNQEDWVNASELKLAKLAEHLLQAADVLSSLSTELREAGELIEKAPRYQLTMAAKAQPEQPTKPPAAPNKPRQSFRSVIADLQKEHGEQFGNYVMGNMLGAARTVESVQKAMKTFLGTFASAEEAAEAFAKAHNLPDADPFEVMANARYRLLHETGFVSIWSNHIAPGDMEGESDSLPMEGNAQQVAVQ